MLLFLDDEVNTHFMQRFYLREGGGRIAAAVTDFQLEINTQTFSQFIVVIGLFKGQVNNFERTQSIFGVAAAQEQDRSDNSIACFAGHIRGRIYAPVAHVNTLDEHIL
jgi:hypothetical protein